ncbi:MAG TPA: hypothetical protein VGM91_12555 [Conexibacter sp.]|jgi:hypothetical protein
MALVNFTQQDELDPYPALLEALGSFFALADRYEATMTYHQRSVLVLIHELVLDAVRTLDPESLGIVEGGG